MASYKNKTVGILGGMGYAATNDLMEALTKSTTDGTDQIPINIKNAPMAPKGDAVLKELVVVHMARNGFLAAETRYYSRGDGKERNAFINVMLDMATNHPEIAERYPQAISGNHIYGFALKEDSGFSKINNPYPELEEEFCEIQKARTDFTYIHCNTAMWYLTDAGALCQSEIENPFDSAKPIRPSRYIRSTSLRDTLCKPLVHLVDAVLDEVYNIFEEGGVTVGLAATGATILAGLYAESSKRMAKRKGIADPIRIINPSAEAQQAIYAAMNVVNLRKCQDDKTAEQDLYTLARAFKRGGAVATIMGCTELPIALDSAMHAQPVSPKCDKELAGHYIFHSTDSAARKIELMARVDFVSRHPFCEYPST